MIHDAGAVCKRAGAAADEKGDPLSECKPGTTCVVKCIAEKPSAKSCPYGVCVDDVNVTREVAGHEVCEEISISSLRMIMVSLALGNLDLSRLFGRARQVDSKLL